MNFKQEVKDFVKESLAKANMVKQETALELLRLVVNDTPVGDPDLWNIPESMRRAIKASGYKGGHLRRNWLASVNVPRGDVAKGIDQTGTQTLNDARMVVAGSKLGDRLIFSNNVHYATRIEYDDYSVQLPKDGLGMMRRNLLDADRIASTITSMY